MSVDPYQPPKTSTQEVDPTLLTEPAYSDGLDFLFLKEFKTPPICIASGAQALKSNAKFFNFPLFPYFLLDRPWLRTLYVVIIVIALIVLYFNHETPWFTPIFVLAINIPNLILFKRSSRMRFCMLKVIKRKYLIKSLIYTLPLIAGFNLITFGIIWGDYSLLMIIAGAICALAGFLLILSITKIYPKAISTHGKYYRLRGAHPDFLAHFPSVPR